MIWFILILDLLKVVFIIFLLIIQSRRIEANRDSIESLIVGFKTSKEECSKIRGSLVQMRNDIITGENLKPLDLWKYE